jgi:hypothetical protein
MTERATRPLVWNAAAAAVAVALGAGAWYALEGAAPDTASSPMAHVPTAPPPAREAPALPPLPPAHAQPAPVQAASAAPVDPAKAQPPPVPAAPSTEAAWHALWSTADATMDGNVRLDDVLDTTQLLLDLAQSRLAAQGLSALADPTAPFVILDEKGVGRATLTLTSSPSDAPEPWRAYTFDVSLDTDDGRYHRPAPGQARPIADVDRPQRGCRRTADEVHREPPEHPRGDAGAACLLGRSRAATRWRCAARVWRRRRVVPALEAVTVDPQTGKPLDEISFFHTMGEKAPRSDSLANPRVAPMTQRLAALGPPPPR